MRTVKCEWKVPFIFSMVEQQYIDSIIFIVHIAVSEGMLQKLLLLEIVQSTISSSKSFKFGMLSLCLAFSYFIESFACGKTL